MKSILFASVVVFFASVSNAKMECRFAIDGVDQGEGLSITDEGECHIGNGYHRAAYKASISVEKEAATIACENTYAGTVPGYSWYPHMLWLSLTNGESKITASDDSYKRVTVSCR